MVLSPSILPHPVAVKSGVEVRAAVPPTQVGAVAFPTVAPLLISYVYRGLAAARDYPTAVKLA